VSEQQLDSQIKKIFGAALGVNRNFWLSKCLTSGHHIIIFYISNTLRKVMISARDERLAPEMSGLSFICDPDPIWNF